MLSAKMDSPACIDVAPFLEYYSSRSLTEPLPPHLLDTGRLLMESFHHTGIVFVKDPRMDEADNQAFIDLMQAFYADLAAENAKANPEEKPLTESKILWCVNEKPQELEEFPNWAPSEYPEFKSTLDKWGETLLLGLKTVTSFFEKAAGLTPGTISQKFENANHILNPSGFDLAELGLGSVLTTIHFDISFITVHGNSRFPVFSVWLRDGSTIDVEIPEGLLMFQAGKIFEYITGGYVLAGNHIVKHTPKTAVAVESARAALSTDPELLRRALWKINSSMFGNFQQDQTVELIPEFESLCPDSVEETRAKYPLLRFDDYVSHAETELARLQEAYDRVNRQDL